MAAACAALALGGGPARALDLFTLWRQPEIPLRLAAGAWADYRTSTLEAGQRTEEVLRVQCLGRSEGGAGPWEIELLPLVGEGERYAPIAGEGWTIFLSDRLRSREGELGALVERVVRWRGGVPSALERAAWQEDPLVSSSLRADFRPQRRRAMGEATRVVAGRELLCRQFELAAAETARITLPRGVLEQVTTREIAVAAHPEVPFLGLAFATERIVVTSRVDPPRAGRPAPPPAVRVEIMELVGFGDGARRGLEKRAPGAH